MQRISDLEIKYVREALNNAFSTSLNGIFNTRLESAFASAYNVKYAIGHVNGTATLHTALASLGVKPEDEVIVPPLTMSSTSLAVLQNGSIPIFCDVDINTFNISPESIRKSITPKTKAIITVALYGLSPEYDEICQICNEFNLGLIEDNAETFYSRYKGKYVGEFGDFASFSFQGSKHITCGEGGMLITNSEEFANNARRFGSLGYAGVDAKQGKITREDIQNPQYDRHVSLGFNYRMSEVTAAVALAQLERANELVNARVDVAKLYDAAVSDSKIVTKQFTPDYCFNSFWSYSLVLNTDNPQVDWYNFRKLYLANGGDGFYAAWKLTYFEPFFYKEVQNMKGIRQQYVGGLCPNSEYLQPRMIQLKTNYWNIEEAKQQSEILFKTVNEF